MATRGSWKVNSGRRGCAEPRTLPRPLSAKLVPICRNRYAVHGYQGLRLIAAGNPSYLIIVSDRTLLLRRAALASFGERLKRTRENKKMSLDDVARATKITTRMLAALEEEKFDQLPGGVFNKGFVRAYARHLELNEEQAIRDYTAAASSGSPEIKSEDAELRAIAERKEKERAGRPRSQGVSWGMVAAFLLILALGLSIWGFLNRERVDSNQALSAASHSSLDDSSAQQHEAAPASVPDQLVPTEVAHTQPLPNESDHSSIATVQTVSSAPMVLVVSAREDSWLSIVVDGQTLFQDTLAAGQKQNISGQNEVVLKSGNIGGLEITFNGKKLPSQGGDAEVKTLTFTPAGLSETDR
jgi:cytoskeleton protein RodZ